LANDIPCAFGRKTRLRRRSVAAVFWALTTFVALQLVFHYPCSQWWPQLYDTEYGAKLTRLQAQLRHRSADQPLMLAVGSSLTGMGVRPGEMATATSPEPNHPIIFNYGIKSGMVIVQSICLRRLLAEGIHPDLILLETYPIFFLSTKYTDPRKIEHIPIQRLQRKDLPLVTQHHYDPHMVRKEWREGQCVPWYFHRNVLMNWYLPNWVPKNKRTDWELWKTDDYGWDSCPMFYEKAKAFYHTPEGVEGIRGTGEYYSAYEINEDLHAVLCELLALCRREKIEVVMVRPPESSPLRAGFSAALNERFERWFARLRAETGAALINARDWVDDENFADGTHLNPDGARDYSRKLEPELLKRLEAARQKGKTITAHR
jgi:hypothetical protein